MLLTRKVEEAFYGSFIGGKWFPDKMATWYEAFHNFPWNLSYVRYSRHSEQPVAQAVHPFSQWEFTKSRDLLWRRVWKPSDDCVIRRFHFTAAEQNFIVKIVHVPRLTNAWLIHCHNFDASGSRKSYSRFITRGTSLSDPFQRPATLAGAAERLERTLGRNHQIPFAHRRRPLLAKLTTWKTSVSVFLPTYKGESLSNNFFCIWALRCFTLYRKP